MKTPHIATRLSLVIGLTGALLAAPAISAPGKGWDTFNIGQGDSIQGTPAYVGTALGGTAGKGFDAFKVGAGEAIPAGPGYLGTAHGGSAGKGWDVFNVGAGDKL